jgi:predicted TIM-barrel fold metal-dependent hydrolase
MLVDAQVHLWAADTPDRPWPSGGPAHLDVPPTVEDTLAVLDAAGVRRAVLVPPSWEGDRNDVVLDAARRHPDRFAVMGRVPLADPASAALLPTWRRSGMAGVRVTLHRQPWRGMFDRGDLAWFWSAAAAADLPVMVYAPGRTAALGAVARAHPDLRLIVDHLALPVGERAPGAFAHLPDLLALAAIPSVAVKATALPCHSRLAHPFPDLHVPLRQVVDAFGPDRVFWGSDWTRLPCAYADGLTFLAEALAHLDDRDLRRITGESVLDWLDWSL